MKNEKGFCKKHANSWTPKSLPCPACQDEKKAVMSYQIPLHRFEAHKMLDEMLEATENYNFIQGRKSAIDELMPHTVQFQAIQKKQAKLAKKPTPHSN